MKNLRIKTLAVFTFKCLVHFRVFQCIIWPFNSTLKCDKMNIKCDDSVLSCQVVLCNLFNYM